MRCRNDRAGPGIMAPACSFDLRGHICSGTESSWWEFSISHRRCIPPTTLNSPTLCGFSTLFPQTWSSFVACIKDYSSSCMNADERTDINRAVGDSINSVHKICTNVDYRRGKSDEECHSKCQPLLLSILPRTIFNRGVTVTAAPLPCSAIYFDVHS